MKIMFSAGEASGDMHGANLAKALRELDPGVELLGMGGARMEEAGVNIIYDIKNLGFIGVGEILRKIPFFFRLRDFLIQKMKEEKPDLLVCIDYPGFNMQLIKKAKAPALPSSITSCRRFGPGTRAGAIRLPSIPIWLFPCFPLRQTCIRPWEQTSSMRVIRSSIRFIRL